MSTRHSLPKRQTGYSLNTKTVRTMPVEESLFTRFDKGFCSFGDSSAATFLQTSLDIAFDFKNNRVSKDSNASINSKASSSIETKLRENKTKLKSISNKVSEKRAQEYDNYLSNNIRYCRLLELNNNKSKVLTSLNSKVGEITIKIIDQHKPEDYEYVSEFIPIIVRGWRPESREGQCCVVYKDNMVLMGGHNSSPLGEVSIFSFKDSTWSRMQDLSLKRSYHSALVYKQHYVIVFGGMSEYNQHFKSRECLNSVCMFSATSQLIKPIKVQNEVAVEPRRSHGAVIVGKQMLIFGGINSSREHLRDMKFLDLRELKWIDLDYKIETPELEEFLIHGIAKHVMVGNFKPREGHNKLYHKDYKETEGVFIFGGTNQVGIRSVLIHINMKRRVPRLFKLYPVGYLPSGVNPIVQRVNQNVLVVVSGDRCERELKVYKINENQFLSVHYQSPLLGGIGSSLVNYRGQMYVFFGVGEGGFMGGVSRFTLEEKLKVLLQREHKRVKRLSFVHKQSKLLPSFFNGDTRDRSL